MEIQPKLLTIQEFLNGKLFRVPQYQRAYSWESRQRKDLFEDIERVQSTHEDHFMATIVGLERKGYEKQIGAHRFSIMEIVDGQQRLTTLILLLKAIQKALKSADKEEQRLQAELATLLVKDDEHTLLLLQTNHDASGIFADYIREGKIPRADAPITADQNILDAISECEQFVDSWKKRSWSLIELTTVIRYRLSAVFHIISDEGLVYRVFEVLNSRGLEVASLDKLKSQLMGRVFELNKNGDSRDIINDLHGIWAQIYRTIGRQRFGTETLRFAATLRAPAEESHKRPLGEQQALETLAKMAGHKHKSIVACAKWLQTVVNAEARLLANYRWRAVTRIVQARLVAIATLVRNDFTEAEVSQLLGLWERVTFRIYGLGRGDKRTKVGDYTTLAWEIVNKNLSATEIESRLRELGSGEYSISQIIKDKDLSDFYNGWTEELRYFFYRYEEHLARAAGEKLNESEWNRIWAVEPAKSIEHIKPQSSGVAYMHHLGNLMMLPPGVNSSLKDSDPSKKANKYRKSGLRSSDEVAEIIKKNRGWSKPIVEDRASKLMKWAQSEWKD